MAPQDKRGSTELMVSQAMMEQGMEAQEVEVKMGVGVDQGPMGSEGWTLRRPVMSS